MRPVDKDKQPEYREWSPKERVSDVQKKEVLNLMADVIRKPGDRAYPDELSARRVALKGDMQKAARDKAQMVKVIEEMNRINGTKKALDAQATADALYGKFGDRACGLLEKAVNEPFNFAKDIGDDSITTSRAAVQALLVKGGNCRD